jgi:hypothetical protein
MQTSPLRVNVSFRGSIAEDYSRQDKDPHTFIMEKWANGLIERHENNKENLLLVYYKREKNRVLKGEF